MVNHEGILANGVGYIDAEIAKLEARLEEVRAEKPPATLFPKMESTTELRLLWRLEAMRDVRQVLTGERHIPGPGEAMHELRGVETAPPVRVEADSVRWPEQCVLEVPNPGDPQPAYLTVERGDGYAYNPAYGDDRTCICGHPYYRHFDSYEDNLPVGCKYCECYTFVERGFMSDEG